jgi:hypothetical protein
MGRGAGYVCVGGGCGLADPQAHAGPVPPPHPVHQDALREAEAAALLGEHGVQGQVAVFSSSAQAVRANPGLAQEWAKWPEHGGDDSRGVCGREARARLQSLGLRCIVYLV